MKTTTFGVVSWAITVVTIVIVLFICDNHSRTVNLQDNLQEAVESSLDTALCSRSYTIADADELIADMMEGIAVYLNNADSLDVDVTSVDMNKGILSVRVTEHYKSVAGETSDISCEKTVLLDHYDTYNIVYGMYAYDGSFVGYKTYEFSKASAHMLVPENPNIYGRTFLGWAMQKSDGTLTGIMTEDEILDLPIDRDYTFIAQFS